MADTKISALTSATAVAGSNEFAINEAGTSKKVSASQITTYINANITLGAALDVNSQQITSSAGTDIELHSDNDVNVILGDAAGADDFNIKDSADAIVFSVTSDGALTAVSYGGITEANLVDKSATETVSGSWTFSSQPNIIISYTAGGTISSGDIVYMDAAGKVQTADADSQANIFGIAQGAATLDNPVNILISGTSAAHSALTVGTDYYLSSTAGALTSTAPTTSGATIIKVGTATATTDILFAPQIIAVRN